MESELVFMLLLVIVAGIFILRFAAKSSLSDSREQEELDVRKLVISVPPNTKWEPTQAHGLLSSLFGLGRVIHLQIVATSRNITWQIQMDDDIQDVVSRSVLSYYPHADITVVDSAQHHIGASLLPQPQKQAEEGIVDWEHETDLRWIADNLSVLSAGAIGCFKDVGRGALTIDMTVADPLEQDVSFWYDQQDELDEAGDRQAIAMVRAYSPDKEMVVALLKPDNRVTNYRVSLLSESEESETTAIDEREGHASEKALTGEPLPDAEAEPDYYCEDCGAAVWAEDTVCPKCGVIFDDEEYEDHEQFAEKSLSYLDEPNFSGQTMLRGAHEYYAPLVYAKDCKSLDPLTGVVGAMSNLAEGESVTYQLELMPTQRNYSREGYKKIRKSQWPMVASALLSAAADAAEKRKTVRVISTPPSLDKYESRYQRVFEDKLSSSLLPVTLSIAIHASTSERWQSIKTAIISATSVFDRQDGNVLTASNKGHPLVLSSQEATVLWHLPTQHLQTQGISWTSGAKATLPVELIQQSGDMLLGHNTYQGKTRPVYLADPDRITHMNIVGKTRVGKTTFMHNLIHQDIAAGKGVAVIDPHGDLVRDILESSIPSERENDVVLFDLADTKHPAPLNLLYVPRGVPRHAAVGLTLGVLKKMFGDQWSATRMEDALYSALAILVDYQGSTIRDIPKLFINEDFRRDVLAKATDEVALEYFYDDYEQMSERYQLEVARPIMNRIRAFYRNPVIRSIVDQPDSIDVRSIMDGKKIFLVSLAGEATQAEASTIGALLISKIQMAAMGRASMEAERRQMFYLYIDEVQNFVTTSLPVMFSEAAKYALSLTVANQFLRQLSGGTLEAVLGNTGTTVIFACGSQDAKDLGAYVKPVFDSEALMNLDRFKTVVKMQKDAKTLPAFNMQTPEPTQKPEDAEEIAQRIRETALAAYTPARAEEEEPTSDPSVAEPSETPAEADKGDIPTLEL